MTRFSVIIPAHDEEAVIGRLLSSLTEPAAGAGAETGAGASAGDAEIVVVCNGCSDATAAVARSFEGVRVVEIPQASKPDALNAGDASAHHFPRFYVDADVEVSFDALRRCAEELASGRVLCAGPEARFDMTGVGGPVRAFYRVWRQMPYFREGRIGMAYGLSAAGRARFDRFPTLTADDQFVAQQFSPAERACLADCTFTVHPPRTLVALLGNRTRIYRGNRELAESGLAAHDPPGGAGRALAAMATRPANWPGLAVYVPVNLLAKRRAARPSKGWERDDTSRPPRGSPEATAGKSVGYVVSRYPAPSHTFVLREVRGLRALGFRVETFSLHAAEPRDLLSPQDREEAASTFSLRPVTVPALVAGHLSALFAAPAGYVSTLLYALRSSPPGVRARVWQVFYFAEAVLLHREASKRRVTHLHAHLANAGADVAWLAAALGRRRAPAGGWTWSFTMHGPTEFYAVEKFNLARKVADAATVVCISEFCRSQLMLVSEPRHWDKLRVVHCGVDTREFAFRPARDRGPDPHPTGSFSLLCVGRLTPEKGQHVLLDAAARIVAEGEDLRVTLVGAGPTGEALRARAAELGIADRVEFTGAVGQDRLAGLFAAADAFCLPSFAEGVPVVLMEAMATGLPVVTTPVAGIPELVNDGETGILVPPGRADLLAAALLGLMRDPDRAGRLARAARRTVEKEFDVSDTCRQLAEVIGG